MNMGALEDRGNFGRSLCVGVSEGTRTQLAEFMTTV